MVNGQKELRSHPQRHTRPHSIRDQARGTCFDVSNIAGAQHRRSGGTRVVLTSTCAVIFSRLHVTLLSMSGGSPRGSLSGGSSDEVAQDFEDSLKDLQANNRYEISNLTIIAKENTEHASAISKVLESHIKTVSGDLKYSPADAVWCLVAANSILTTSADCPGSKAASFVRA